MALNAPQKLYILLLCAFLANSCKNEIINSKSINNPGISWAKSYFDEQLEKRTTISANILKIMSNDGAIGRKIAIRKSLKWDKTNSGQTPNYKFVEIPIDYNYKISNTITISKGNNVNGSSASEQEVIAGSFDRAIIYKSKYGVTNQRIISFIPDIAYLRKHNGNILHNKINNLDKDFFGFLAYKNWEGDILFILRIENGIAVKKFNIPKQTVSFTKPNSLQEPILKYSTGKVSVAPPEGDNCYTVYTNYYTQWCYYENNGTLINCDPREYAGTISSQICSEDGTGGVTEITINCADPLNFNNAACKSLVETMNEGFNTDSLTDDCIKQVIEELKNTKLVGNHISDMLHNFFEKNEKYKISVFERTNLPDSMAAFSDPQITLTSNIVDVKVYLNMNILKSASKEYIATILMHEVIHGYLKFQYRNQENQQHEQIASDYVFHMQAMLMAMYPTIPSSDAWSLGWEGLYNTSKWRNMFHGELILVNNTEYRTALWGTTGTLCN